ncbi:SLC13 family permease [Rhizobium leguminosarum]|uniref:Cation transporter n=1 Tax=Rhizobium leguminosarum TaxID=384 RepID=A0A6P0DI59_RHILE|nr:SLC13 family permease [Rhizobium leguminosarum]MDH6660909.1 di/tricarboxylate transporter [Rhizobium sophorae]ASS55965.1 cation transporter [Rhizobium leguminosarum bv. viciae]AVC51258.1 sulfate symporter transmembrane region family protein [Rhizobium leguminosarum bv. viciae]MBB4329934.1 di/tricarboxylate transporter [Rhizobium leguminosarum]MBB4343574.1 di/tricarboxylate transporter [Rhizobium leguminosarum]
MFEQASLLILLLAMLTLFSLDRIRIEVVSIAGLLAGYALGLYPADQIFTGFASPVVITVVEILLIVQVLARARLFDSLAARFAATRPSDFTVIAGTSALAGFMSIFMNNIGAFAITLPVALRLGAALKIPRRQLAMPVSFAALLGGLVSLIGTPANLLVSDGLAKATGAGFRFFDFAYNGLPVAIAGILLIAFRVQRLFPEPDETPVTTSPAARRVVVERYIPDISPLIGVRLSDCPVRFGIKPHALIRGDNFVFGPLDQSVIEPGDVLLAEGADAVFADLAATQALMADAHPHGLQPDFTHVEAVVMPESTLVGSRVRSLEIFHRRGIAVTALSMRAPRIEGRFLDLQLSIGDILTLEGPRPAISEALEESECLPLASTAPAEPALLSWRPFALFACGVAASAAGLRPDVAFAGVVLVLALLNHLNIRRAMADLNWPIIIMLAAMIPIGQAVASTGAAETIASWLSLVVPITHPLIGIALILFLAMALTPFVNNATVAIVLTPIALEFARAGRHAPDAYLIAVAAGASLDFLTPFGHHNNTLAMGIGGYRFGDFLRAGWPLAVTSYGLALLLTALFWL